MSVPEIIDRIAGYVRAYLEKMGFGLAMTVPAPNVDSDAGTRWLHVDGTSDSRPYVAAAQRVLRGTWDVFALRDVQMGFPPDWNVDCKTGVRAPMTFGKTLDYRNERLVGNVKYLWEPSRHLELVTICQAFHLTRDMEFAVGAKALLQSWFGAAKYPMGPHWTSSLELAVRLVNWAVAWQLLGGVNSPVFEGTSGQLFLEQWTEQIYRHCHFISRHFYRHSSANNHLLGEYMGLFVAAATWPWWNESRHWQNLAKRGFETQALLQNSSDGVNREQAIWYQHEVMDMMLICGLVARAKADDFGPEYWKRLEAMTEYVGAMMNVRGAIPMVGDSDDAVMVRFSPEEGFDVYRSLLATGAVLFDRPDFKAQAREFDAKSLWLLGSEGRRRFESVEAPELPTVRREFREAGAFLMGSDFGMPNEVKLIADAGSLGYLSIAAHGHADALSFVLSVRGAEVLVDAGTYAYHTERKWRDYFRGTSAHNTVRVDGLDQSVIGGNFMWLEKANACLERCQLSGSEQILVMSHDGYKRLPDPVVHRREIRFSVTEGAVHVTDELVCRASHGVEICWHFGETFQVTIEQGKVIARGIEVVVNLEMLSGSLLPEVLCGDPDRPAGWISRRFDTKQPCPTVIWSGRAFPAEALTTRIHFEQVKRPVAADLAT